MQVQAVKVAVMQKLQARDDTQFCSEWKKWFDSIPRSCDEAHESYFNVLHELSKNHSGIFVKSASPSVKSFLKDTDYVDPITFRGGPVTSNERVELLTSIRMYTPFVASAEETYKKNVESLGISILSYAHGTLTLGYSHGRLLVGRGN
jgi:hypothetical protein